MNIEDGKSVNFLYFHLYVIWLSNSKKKFLIWEDKVTIISMDLYILFINFIFIRFIKFMERIKYDVIFIQRFKLDKIW